MADIVKLKLASRGLHMLRLYDVNTKILELCYGFLTLLLVYAQPWLCEKLS
jgi:hypothetical protein